MKRQWLRFASIIMGTLILCSACNIFNPNSSVSDGGLDLPSEGLDKIFGLQKVEKYDLDVLEDTYVEGGANAKNILGASDKMDLKAKNGTSSNLHRIIFLKFDVSDVYANHIMQAQLYLYCNSMENAAYVTPISVYACDPNAWSEDSLTYRAYPSKGELIAEGMVSGTGNVALDVEDYLKEAVRQDKEQIAFYIESGYVDGTPRRLTFETKEKKNGSPAKIEIRQNDVNFTTDLEYAGVNPWEVAIRSVGTWFERWEEIQEGGDENVEQITVDDAEYTTMVDVANAGQTNGYNTQYTARPTRLLTSLNDYQVTQTEKTLYDVYGGFTGGDKYDATGYFYTKKIGDRWQTVDPLGYPFYRVACVSVGIGSLIQKESALARYGTKENWAQSATDRLKELGFNSTGGWSEIEALSAVEKPLSQTMIVGMAGQYASSLGTNTSTSGNTELTGAMIPVFDPAFSQFADTRAKSVAKYADNPNIYGWMSDNELPASHKMLDNALAFDCEDSRFIYSYAAAWTFMYLKTGEKDVSVSDVTDELRDEFKAMVYDKYFEIASTAIKKYDPNHQYLGNRFISQAYKNEKILRVAGYWCDTISINYYNAWTPSPDDLFKFQSYSGKPFIITEWYAKGMDVWEEDNRMTNKSGAGWTVRTQADRGKFYQNFTLALLQCKGCVGFDWFKYLDNNPDDTSTDLSNRNANKGIYSNTHQEYTEMTAYMDSLNNNKYSLIRFFDQR